MCILKKHINVYPFFMVVQLHVQCHYGRTYDVCTLKKHIEKIVSTHHIDCCLENFLSVICP